jgi:hypothetical protein
MLAMPTPTENLNDLLPFLFWTLMLMGAAVWLLAMAAQNLDSWINK